MNKVQWLVTGIFCLLMGMLFMSISLPMKVNCDMFAEATISNIFACVRDQSFSPFVYIFHSLFILCLVLAWLEPKKK